jgi:hypothetical protein
MRDAGYDENAAVVTRTVCLLRARRRLKEKRGRPAGQAAKLIEDRLLLLSKTMTPCMTTAGF